MEYPLRNGICCAILLTAAWLLASTGCDQGSSQPPVTRPSSSELRIISLSPAISRTLIDFHLQDRIVGRTPHCASIDQSIPIVGDLLNVDYEAIIRLKPTHVLVQPPASGLDSHLIELASQQGWVVGQWMLNGRDDIEAMVSELPTILYADGTPERAQASRRAAEIVSEIAQALTPGRDPLFRGSILIVHSVDPLLVSGANSYLNDIITTLGAANAARGRGWIQLTLEDVIRINPQAIILVKPGVDPHSSPLESLGPLKDLPIDAIRDKRIAILTNPDGDMPSSGLIGLARDVRDILHRFHEGTP